MESVAPTPVYSLQRALVKYHDARGYLHYDFRLQWNGVLLSWALPYGLSDYPGDHKIAIEVDDHSIKDCEFEGVRERDTFMLWDSGTWEPEQDCVNIEASLRKGVLRFKLDCKKLKGSWTLTRTHKRNARGHAIWTLSKNPDSFARNKDAISIMIEAPNGVASGNSMDEIRHSKGKKGPKSEPTLF